MSQEAFADVLGIHRTYMGGIERGERNLTLQTIERLAESLRVSPLDLLAGPGPRKKRGRPATTGRHRRATASDLLPTAVPSPDLDRERDATYQERHVQGSWRPRHGFVERAAQRLPSGKRLTTE
jgi:transcriptional regulator with XRE-family HTH domain